MPLRIKENLGQALTTAPVSGADSFGKGQNFGNCVSEHLRSKRLLQESKAAGIRMWDGFAVEGLTAAHQNCNGRIDFTNADHQFAPGQLRHA